MSIASVTITRNDWHVLEQWQRFYREYGSAIDHHIIVDNASEPAYRQKLRELFPDSILLERSTNGGTTAAYNDGVKWALENPEIEAVMLIANDLKLDAAGVEKLYGHLMADRQLGAIAPIMLNKDEKTIVAYGEKLRPDMGLNRLYEGATVDAELPEMSESECLPGGMCMVKCEVYRKVGLQDESLFMYMDENDFFYRTRLAGYRLTAMKAVVSAHCHIPVDNGRGNDSGLAWFYIVRNHMLVCRKYARFSVCLKLYARYFFWGLPKYSLVFAKDRTFKKIYYAWLGFFCGLTGIRLNWVHN